MEPMALTHHSASMLGSCGRPGAATVVAPQRLAARQRSATARYSGSCSRTTAAQPPTPPQAHDARAYLGQHQLDGAHNDCHLPLRTKPGAHLRGHGAHGYRASDAVEGAGGQEEGVQPEGLLEGG